MKKRITKSEWRKISITALFIIGSILLRFSLRNISEDWKFLLDVLEYFIAVLFIPLLYYIFKQYGISVLK